MDKKIEAKKHGVKQLQGNDWVVTLVVSNEDFHTWGIAQDGMGTIYTMEVLNAEEEAFKADYTPIELKPLSEEKKQEARECVKRIMDSQTNTEGDKIRKWAFAACKKDAQFRRYAEDMIGCLYLSIYNEDLCAQLIYDECNIKSRSELTTNRDAQGKFLELMDKFNGWKIEQRYADDLTKP